MALVFCGAMAAAAPVGNTNTNWLPLATLLKKWEPVPMPEIQQAAAKGDVLAEHYLGYCFAEGLRVKRNPKFGATWYQRAMQAGYLPSANNLGLLYQRGLLGSNDLAKAVYYYKFAADRGLAQAQANLGFLYRDGQGVPADPVEAMRWFRLAADQGHAGAMVEIGRLYRFGLGVSTNLSEAIRWFQRAANEKNNALARLNIGLLYQDSGRAEDAIPYFQQAAEAGLADAMTQLYCCYWEGNGVVANHATAMHWLTKAADTGNAYAECLMGYRCEYPEWEGEGASHHLPKPDWKGAVRWYRRSAERNWAGGQYNLGLLYLDGKAVEMDEAHGLELVRAAADQGMMDAKRELANLYARGVGEPRSQQETPMALLEQTSDWDALQFRYEHGLGTPRDLVMAAICFSKLLLHGTWYYSSSDLADKVELKSPRDDSTSTPLLASPDDHTQILGPPHRSHNPSDDVLRALSLYLKSARGDGSAAHRIGSFYLKGLNAPQSTPSAWAWFKIAAQNGDASAREIISTLDKQMTADERKSAQARLAAITTDLRQVAPAVR